MRIVIAGLLGGILMFVWMSIAHLATPLATAGLSPLPGGDATVTHLQQQLGNKSALYFFPYAAGTDSKSMAAQQAKMQSEPHGMLVYNAPGANLTARQMITEFVLEVVESILLGIVLLAGASFGDRMRLAVVVGIVAAVSTNISYWNWYGFGAVFTCAAMIMELIKYLVAGVFIAWWLGRAERTARALSDVRLSGH